MSQLGWLLMQKFAKSLKKVKRTHFSIIGDITYHVNDAQLPNRDGPDCLKKFNFEFLASMCNNAIRNFFFRAFGIVLQIKIKFLSTDLIDALLLFSWLYCTCDLWNCFHLCVSFFRTFLTNQNMWHLWFLAAIA